jgi:hypothetical protein
MFKVGGDDEFAVPSGFNAVLLHEPVNRLLPNAHSIGMKLSPDSWPAIIIFAGGVRCLDVSQSGCITEAFARYGFEIRILAPLKRVIHATPSAK